MKKLTFYILSILVFFSCNERNDESVNSLSDNEQAEISVSFEPIKKAPGISFYDKTPEMGFEIGSDNEFFITDDFSSESLLYISQLGPSLNPNFNPNDNYESLGAAYPYCYVYQYYENLDANWYEDYNFRNVTGRQSILWTKIRDVGSVGNAFSFFAFHYPVDDEIKWEVIEDQTGSEDPYDPTNFMKSDILGAYHATSNLYSRLRFRLFHLMVYLKITLYVPVYENYTSPVNEITYSGYEKDAMIGGFVMNANTRFSIEWRANRSSDTEPPLVQSDDKVKTNIHMYLHPNKDSSDDGQPIDNVITLENVKDFYPSYKGPDNKDNVRAYNFSVLFPSQTFGDRFLCFVLKDIEGNKRYYYFSPNSQLVGESGNYSLTQGTLQQLYLYLPRTTNETILVGAKILPWLGSQTDMTVNKEKDNSSGFGEDMPDNT